MFRPPDWVIGPGECPKVPGPDLRRPPRCSLARVGFVDLGLAGKTVVVTGASRGIGLAVTEAFAGEGARVVAGARTITAELAALARSDAVEPVAVDLATATGPAQLVEAARGQVDVVVNNVGTASTRPSGFLGVTDEHWLATMNLNLMAAIRTVRAALPGMIAAGTGSIVMIGSINSSIPAVELIDYSVSKAALALLAKSLSKEYGPHGIRVNTVSPGPVSTELWLGEDGLAAQLSQVSGEDPQAIAATVAKAAPTGRFTHANEVADLVLMLAGDRAANVTGSDFLIDGGLLSAL